MGLDRTVEPSLEGLIRGHLDRAEIEIRGPMPGRIESYDAATQTANVMPMLRLPVAQPDGSVAQEDPPVVPNVPVLFPRVGAWFLSMPVAPGDFVLLVPCEGDWSSFWSRASGTDGALSDVPDVRRHHLAHCVALLGFYPEREALGQTQAAGADGVVFGSDDASGPRVQLRADGDTEVATGGGTGAKLLLKSNGTVEVTQSGVTVAKIDTTGTVSLGGIVGDFVALSTLVSVQFATIIALFNSHTHTVTNATPAGPGPVVTVPPVPLMVPTGSVAAVKVKAV